MITTIWDRLTYMVFCQRKKKKLLYLPYFLMYSCTQVQKTQANSITTPCSPLPPLPPTLSSLFPNPTLTHPLFYFLLSVLRTLSSLPCRIHLPTPCSCSGSPTLSSLSESLRYLTNFRACLGSIEAGNGTKLNASGQNNEQTQMSDHQIQSLKLIRQIVNNQHLTLFNLRGFKCQAKAWRR